MIAEQAVKGRERVYPYMSVIRQQVIDLQLPNLAKADMEVCRLAHTHTCYQHLVTPVRVTPQGCPMYTMDFSNYSECCAAL